MERNAEILLDPNRSTGVRLAIVRFSSALSNQKFPFADPAALNRMTTPPLPEQIELHRDRMWRRDEELRIESAASAERFIEDVGFANTLTDARRAGPSSKGGVPTSRDLPWLISATATRFVVPEGRDVYSPVTAPKIYWPLGSGDGHFREAISFLLIAEL